MVRASTANFARAHARIYMYQAPAQTVGSIEAVERKSLIIATTFLIVTF
jgi:hypothetical protein